MASKSKPSEGPENQVHAFLQFLSRFEEEGSIISEERGRNFEAFHVFSSPERPSSEQMVFPSLVL